MDTGNPNDIDLDGKSLSGTLAEAARVRTSENCLVAENGYPASGAMTFIQLGTNRESYDLNAGSGNLNTFIFTANIEGDITAYEILWSETRRIGDLELASIDVGF